MILNKLELIATVSLDFYTNNIKTINVKQYDSKSRYIQISFTEHGKKVALNKDAMSVITRYKKADGKFGLLDCEILDDGTAMIQTTEQMLAVAGRCRLDVVILESNGLNVKNYCDATSLDDIDCAILSTMPLDLNVIVCPVNDGELQSEYDFTALNSALAETKAAEADLIAKHAEWEIKESVRQQNEDARIESEKTREENVQNTIEECNKKIIDATNATDAANTAAGEANEAKMNANAEAQNCQNVYKSVSENAKQVIDQCETARDRANAAAKDCEDIVTGSGVVMQKEKGQADGVASLDEAGKVPLAQLPNIQSDWNAIEATEGAIKNKPPITGGTGKPSIVLGENNIAISDYTSAFGNDTISGLKGYYIKSIDLNNKKIYLCNEKVSPIISNADYTDASFQTPAYSVDDEISIINYFHYVLCAKITAISNNVIIYSGDLGFTEFAADDGIDGHTLYVASKPTVGIVDLGGYSFAEGQGNKAVGRRSHAGGRNSIAAGGFSHTEGSHTIAGYVAHAEGGWCEARGAYSHAEGSSSISCGQGSHAEGGATKANGQSSHAEGNNTQANELASHAEGNYTVANNKYAHAEGTYTKANGLWSHAEGCETQANGESSHAENGGTIANGKMSHAEGGWTKAIGYYSHAEGHFTIAKGTAQHVQGKFNVEDTQNKYAHIVGGGASDTDRKNIHTLDWNGNAWYKSISLGGTHDNPKVSLTYNEDTGRLVINVS